ncbi:rna polymerase iii subunit rpc34 [Moniliophthora roreri]|nr:rna polymerase iii subunit rpc34 [Moniliophthora roreri]
MDASSSSSAFESHIEAPNPGSYSRTSTFNNISTCSTLNSVGVMRASRSFF